MNDRQNTERGPSNVPKVIERKKVEKKNSEMAAVISDAIMMVSPPEPII